MYQVYGDGNLLHDDRLDGYRVTDATIDLELGKSGSFAFTIYPDHPSFAVIEPMKTKVTVFKYSHQIYCGRVLNIQYGFYGEKQVSCEGELAFLLDSMLPPHKFNGSLSGYLSFIINDHNAFMETDKRFTMGRVTVGNYSPFVVDETEYKSAYDLLSGNILSQVDGYLHVRYEGTVRYLDLLSYTADVSDISGQTIEVGANLLDIKRETNSSNMFSAIIPLGAKLADSDTRLDVSSVNNYKPYIVNETAKALCGGLIYRVVVFDDITNDLTLLTAGADYLAEHYAGESSIEITAADLSGMDASIDSFDLGRWVRVRNWYHFADGDQMFLIKKMTVDLSNPAGNKIMIGEVKKGITDAISQIADSVKPTKVESVQPYLLESGTTGIWSWKKFSDNTCEFFGKIGVTQADVTTALGSWYRGANLYDSDAYPYPFTMTEAPALNMMFQTRNGLAAFVWVNSIDAATAQQYVPQAFLVRPTTATGIYGNINIIGKGKLSS